MKSQTQKHQRGESLVRQSIILDISLLSLFCGKVLNLTIAGLSLNLHLFSMFASLLVKQYSCLMVWKILIKEILGVHCICVNRDSFLSGDIHVPLTLFCYAAALLFILFFHFFSHRAKLDQRGDTTNLILELDLILVNIWNITAIELSCNNHLSLLNGSSADLEGGPGVRNPPPLKFVRGGVLCRGLMGRRGGPTIVFAVLLSPFFLARFARQYYTNMFSMEQSFFFSFAPHPNYE